MELLYRFYKRIFYAQILRISERRSVDLAGVNMLAQGRKSATTSRISGTGMEEKEMDEGGEITGESRRRDEERNRLNANVPRGEYARVAASVGGGGIGGGCLNFRYFNRAAYSCNKSFLLGCL